MLVSLLQRRINAFMRELRAPLLTSDLTVVMRETPVGAAISMLNGAIIVIAGWGHAPAALLLAWGIYTIGLNAIVLGQSLARPTRGAPPRRPA